MASKQGYGADLAKYLDKRLDIRLNANRKVAGILKGYDQFMNIVLDHAIELGETQETSRKIGTVLI
jgi:small nuclear ribonucleoprotein G